MTLRDAANGPGDADVGTDVVIAGAGPVGLAVALGLARRGVRSVVLESKAVLDPHSRATLVVPRALEILDELGLLPRFLDGGEINREIDIRRAGDRRPILRFDFAALASETATPFAVAIPQDRTEAILLDAVRATGLVDVRFGAPLRRFEDHGDGVTVEFGARGPARTVRARYLVGADGAHSVVREQLGWTLRGKTYPTQTFLADVRVTTRADRGRGWLADPDAASFTIAVRFGDRRWRLIESAVPAGVRASALPDRARAVTERVFGAGAWQETLWTAAYRKHERRAETYHAGRVVLAGDAAHLNSPAGGQGLNAGLQDTHSLAWRLARILDGRGDPGVLLGSYTAERTRSFDRDVRSLTDGIERMETLPAPLRRILFSAVGLVRATSMPKMIARKLSMLAPTLTPSPLLTGDPPVGRRLPNFALADGARIYDHLQADGLLITGVDTPMPAVIGHYGPDIGVVRVPGGFPAPFRGHAWLFVRPDHIVAVATAAGRPSAEQIGHVLGDRAVALAARDGPAFEARRISCGPERFHR